MMKLRDLLNGGTFDYVPPTFVFPREKQEFLDYKEQNKKAMFIAKPQNGSQGDSIVLFNDLK